MKNKNQLTLDELNSLKETLEFVQEYCTLNNSLDNRLDRNISSLYTELSILEQSVQKQKDKEAEKKKMFNKELMPLSQDNLSLVVQKLQNGQHFYITNKLNLIDEYDYLLLIPEEWKMQTVLLEIQKKGVISMLFNKNESKDITINGFIVPKNGKRIKQGDLLHIISQDKSFSL